ncbi:hypothetical protein FPOAC1_011462 [Fusarium poae]|uniref:hypothetical protein n=1 Tax=Fusarium poae TaxID=36050 RepID=UPI001CE7B00C|nr:hypothetical protein FPOAC1_011462 [Fusarium poae]KAG8666652.1 hypothetical protein FPOAC1_011462 [Fusarium poae]
MATKPTSPWRPLSVYTFAIFTTLTCIALYAASWRDSGLNSYSGIIDGRNLHDNASSSFTKRSDAYDKAVTRGRKLHCLMGLTQEEAKQANGGASLESPDYLQLYPGIEENEGWNVYYEDPEGNAPWFKNYLDQAFRGLGIEKKVHNEAWCDEGGGHIFKNPLDPDIDEYEDHWSSGAFYFTSYIIDAGVVIGDNAQSVKHSFHKMFPNLEGYYTKHMTHLQQWSDVVWLQWLKACMEESGDVSNINYIFQSQITNADTLGILFEALLKWGSRGVTIGKWEDRVTLDVRKDEDKEAFYAFLGSPHGSMSSYLLLNHKEKLGVRTINKVDIFVPNIPWTIIGEGA